MSGFGGSILKPRSPLFWGRILAVGLVFCWLILLFFESRFGLPRGRLEPAFYFWKTEFELSAADENQLNSLKINRLYLHLFDIDLDENSGRPVPQGFLEGDSSFQKLANLEVVGCIFLTNRVFLKRRETSDKRQVSGDFQADFLTEKLLGLVAHFEKKLPGGRLAELQIDCDWTASTREAYFLFLKKLGKKRPALARSATIRLHQFLRPGETGIPPVDRGLLMIYNTGDLDNWTTENSILDSTDARKWLFPKQPFPLELDVALPLFRWGAVFRDGEFFKLFNGLDSSQLIDRQRFEVISRNRFEVKKETFLNGLFLHEGDLIRLESAETGQLEWAARQVFRLRRERRLNGGEVGRVVFFHLDSAASGRFSEAFLEKLVR